MDWHEEKYKQSRSPIEDSKEITKSTNKNKWVLRCQAARLVCAYTRKHAHVYLYRQQQQQHRHFRRRSHHRHHQKEHELWKYISHSGMEYTIWHVVNQMHTLRIDRKRETNGDYYLLFGSVFFTAMLFVVVAIMFLGRPSQSTIRFLVGSQFGLMYFFSLFALFCLFCCLFDLQLW